MGKPAHMSEEGWQNVIAARNQFWEKVKRGEIPHPTKGKKRKVVTGEEVTGPKNNGQKQPRPFSPQKRRTHASILDRIKVATLQLVEIDAMPIIDIENTFNSFDECDRGLIALEQLSTRVSRMHVLVSYCKDIQTSTLRRIKAHEKGTLSD
jgi:hypothetical protein